MALGRTAATLGPIIAGVTRIAGAGLRTRIIIRGRIVSTRTGTEEASIMEGGTTITAATITADITAAGTLTSLPRTNVTRTNTTDATPLTPADNTAQPLRTAPLRLRSP